MIMDENSYSGKIPDESEELGDAGLSDQDDVNRWDDASDEKEMNIVSEEPADTLGADFTEPEAADEPEGCEAYTVPVEQTSKNAFSPPAFTAPTFVSKETVPPRRRGGGLKFVAIIAVAVALIILTSSFAYLISNYDIRVWTEEGSLRFSMDPRGRDGVHDVLVPALPSPEKSEVEEPLITTAPGADVTLPIATVEEAGTGLTKLSYPDIFEKCKKSIVQVKTVAAGGYYIGTGIIMSEDGYIITNWHVIENGQKIIIVPDNGKEYTAALVGQDAESDLAVLKIDINGLVPAVFGDSDALRVGEAVVAIGNPLGQNKTITDGIISGINRDIRYENGTLTLLQTSAALNEGSSGGALINLYGQVIGITNMKLISNAGQVSVEGMGYAIPVSVVKEIVDQILKDGHVTGRPALGMTFSNLSSALLKYYGISQGIRVENVSEESDAYEKEIAVGDIITEANGKPLSGTSELKAMITKLAVGDVMSLTVFRDGNTFQVDITLVEKSLVEKSLVQ